MSEPRAFWLIWSPDGDRPPNFRHWNVERAQIEAKRLSSANPGKRFYVLRSIGEAFTPVGVTFTYHDGALDMDVPF